MRKVFNLVKNEVADVVRLMRCIPASAMVMFTISLVLMNLMANKEIYTGLSWLALDCGLLLSWLSFLCMDMLTRRFGPKASIKLSVVAVLVNLFVCLVLKGISLIPGNWGDYYAYGDVANEILNHTFGGTWYVLFGSTIAFIVSAVVNALLNYSIGKMFKKKSFKEYAVRSYISTLLAQFIDNLTFALIVSHNFFGWSMLQCITCSITGCIVELICEIVFSPVGYRMCQQWEKDKVGQQYLDTREKRI